MLLNGRVIGQASAETCAKVATELRALKALALVGKGAGERPAEPLGHTAELRGDGEVDGTLEVAYIPPVKGGPAPGLFLFTGPARVVRPVLQLQTGRVEWVGAMEQVFMEVALLEEDVRLGVRTWSVTRD